MASPPKKYTRSNPDPNPHEQVENPKRILKFKKQLEESQPPILERIVSVETDSVKTIDDLKFDLKFEHSLFDSKSDLDLSEVVIDIPGLNTFIPKKWTRFSNKEKYLFWSLLS